MSAPPINGTPAMEMREVASLVPDARNARTHSPEQVSVIAGSIAEFGFNDPVEILPDGRIVAGHGRVLAAHRMGMESVPCVVLEHLHGDDVRRRAYALANNRIAELSGWDHAQLALEIEGLSQADINLDNIGFSAIDIEQMHLDGEQDGSMSGLDDDDAKRDCEVVSFTVAVGDGARIKAEVTAIAKASGISEAPESVSFAFNKLLDAQ